MAHALADGTVFAGRYRVVRCIAAGGMGAVYEVLHLETERRRALKVMLPHVLGSAELRERFKREAKIAAGIESEHIIEVFDAGLDEATEMPFLVMELLRGEDLSKRLKRTGRFPPNEVLTYLQQAALALDDTHKASVVHRDLKPDNLFLTERRDGTPWIKVLDFGIAKLIADSASSGPTQAVGTPLYMAPEQFRMTAHVSAAIDRYALGMIAYTLLVGEPYWREEARANPFAFAAVAVRGAQEAATARAARAGVTLPPAFDVWFAKATAIPPEQRYPSATATVDALRAALSGAPFVTADLETETPTPLAPARIAVPAPPPSAPTTDISLATISVTGHALAAPAPRRRGLLVLAAVAVAAVGALGWLLGRLATPGPVSAAASPATATSEAPPPPPSATTPPPPAESATAPAPPTASAESPPEAKPTAKAPQAAAPRRPRPAKKADDDIYQRQ